jgi:hypothetical protein
MSGAGTGGRGRLFRDSVIFQLKLLADGFRDFALLPVSLFATAIGLLRGGEEADREFRQVIDLGRQTERWINLFGHHEPIEQAGQAGTLDSLLTRAEEVVREQVRSGGISETASQALDRALGAAREKVRKDRS